MADIQNGRISNEKRKNRCPKRQNIYQIRKKYVAVKAAVLIQENNPRLKDAVAGNGEHTQRQHYAEHQKGGGNPTEPISKKWYTKATVPENCRHRER